MVYYNEIDPYAAQWLRNLIAAGHIASGVVDERSICNVDSADLADFTQCHFFAGIGVWSLALRRAGWPDDRPVWTGSCPCQPFSAAGKRDGFSDERHLWPHLFRLIAQRRPAVVFGEQVASRDGLEWLDLVQADLEGADYASAAVDICAAGVGAPHIRQRLYWVAISEHSRCKIGKPQWSGTGSVMSSGVADGLADASNERHERYPGDGREAQRWAEHAGDGCRPGPTNGHWADADWLYCRDDKWRPVEPGTFPLANGAPSRVGRLRGYGNAIVATQAEEFIKAFMSV